MIKPFKKVNSKYKVHFKQKIYLMWVNKVYLQNPGRGAPDLSQTTLLIFVYICIEIYGYLHQAEDWINQKRCYSQQTKSFNLYLLIKGGVIEKQAPKLIWMLFLTQNLDLINYKYTLLITRRSISGYFFWILSLRCEIFGDGDGTQNID